MATTAQIIANQHNARKSSGPKTQKGKLVASKNAIKHGLTSTRIVIQGEDLYEFEDALRNLEQELEPSGHLESETVKQIAVHMWRLRRVILMETAILDHEQAEKKVDLAERDLEEITRELDHHHNRIEIAGYSDDKSYDKIDDDDEYLKIEGVDEIYREIEEAQKKCKAAVDRISAAKKELKTLSARSGTFFFGEQKYTDALDKLLRYEVAIDRSLSRAEDRLRRMQRDRRERTARSSKNFFMTHSR